MNRKKKLISIVLVLAMLISSLAMMMPVAAAESASIESDTDNTAPKTVTVLGDMNGDGEVNTDDAIYLLRHALMPGNYPISQSGDVNGDKEVNTDDAIYLLRHALMPDNYPLLSACEHSVVTDVGISPTCTEKGLGEGSHCEKCGEVFVAQQVLSATGHEYIFNSEIEAPDGEDAYKCEYCGDIKYVAEEDGISAVYAEDSREFDRTPDFTFDIIYDGDKEYIYENLSLVNEILDDAGLEANVEYTLTDLGNGVWRVSPKENYKEYVTYYAKLGGNLKFKDYNGTKLTFDIYGEEKSEVSFNEGIIFLKKLESDNPGYFPYTLTFNEQTELFTLVLSKVGTFTQEHVGKILCIGDYSSTEEILSDATKECTFGKIKSVAFGKNGTCTIVLEAPQISEVFKELDVSTSQSVLFSEEMFDESFDSYVIESFTQSDGFAEFAASATLAAESYASDNGLMLAAKKDSILDHIKFKDITPQISDDYKTITVTVGGDLVYDLEKNGKAYGSLKVGFEAVFTINFDFFLDYTTDYEGVLDFERIELRIDQNTAFDLHLYVSLDVDVHSEKLYVVNLNSHKIHKEDCRIPGNANGENLEKYNSEGLKAYFNERDLDLLEHECKVCQAISQYDGSLYILNNNTNTLHCQDCSHAKNLDNATYVFELITGADYCEDCKPQTRAIPDFGDRMLNSMKSSNWSKTLDKIKAEVEKGNLENDNSLSKDIKEFYFTDPTGLFTLRFDIDFEFAFMLNVNLDYKAHLSGTTSYGVVITIFEDSKVKTYVHHGNPTLSQTLHFAGSVRTEAGVLLNADVSVIGMNEWLNVGLTARAGAYADLAGVLHLEDVITDESHFENDYAAAYFETGLYFEMYGKAKVPFLGEMRTDSIGGDIPVYMAGYNKVYHSYAEYERTIEVGDGTDLNEVDLLMVKYLDLTSMSENLTELDAAGIGGKYNVRYEFYNADGTQNEYFSVKDGVIDIADGAPDEFTVTMYVYVDGEDDAVKTFSDFLSNKFQIENAAYFLEEYEVVLKNKKFSKGLEYTLSSDGTYYIVSGIGTCTDTDVVIPDVYNDLPVKSIGDRAFDYCDDITSVKIPSSTTYIGGGAFWFCSNLEFITLSEGLTYIGVQAFWGCISIDYVTIPASVTNIDLYAFGFCENLKEITVNENNTTYKSIEGNLYSKDGTTLIQYAIGKKATSFDILDSVVNIGYGAFYACHNLITVEIPNEITNIGGWAFNYCDNLVTIVVDDSNGYYKSINGNLYSKDGTTLIQYAIGKNDTSYVVPEGVMIIQSGAFEGCKNLSSVVIPVSTTSIGSHAFSWCENLTSITIPNSVTSIRYSALEGCEALSTIQFLGTKSEWDNITKGSWWDSNAGTNTSKGTYTVVFRGETEVKHSEGLVYTINWSNTYYTVAGIGTCTDTDVIIPDVYNDLPVKSIGDRAFGYCSALISIEIPNSVTSIGDFAFMDCGSLTNIEIPNSVTSIGDGAFDDCSSLTNIEIPNSVTSIGDGTFYFCSSLTNIEIPNSVTSIGDDAFMDCSSLTSIEMPNSVTSIGDGAFIGCSSLTSIEIPNSVTSIGDNAFIGCTSLTSIEIPNSVTSIGSTVFGNCSSLMSIEIPNSVTSIGGYAFVDCSSLTSIEIPNSVTSISPRAFWGCSSLTSIEIPNSVTSIGDFAFSGCTSLNTITFDGTVEQWNALTFGSNWNKKVPATTVQCSDGTVALS